MLAVLLILNFIVELKASKLSGQCLKNIIDNTFDFIEIAVEKH